MTTRRLSPGHGCGLCGVRDWGYDKSLGRWVCLNCAWKGVPIPEVPNFKEVFDFDNWYEAVMKDYDECSGRLGRLQMEPEPEGEAQKIIHRAELKRVDRELGVLYDLSTIAMFSKQMREMAISKGGDFYFHLPACSLQIRFDASSDS